MLNKALLSAQSSKYEYMPSHWGTADNWEHLKEPYRSIRRLLSKPFTGSIANDLNPKLKEVTDVPSDLFKYCSAVTDFSWCFSGCTGLTTLPADLFKNCSAVTDFKYCFYGCSNLTATTLYYSSRGADLSNNPSQISWKYVSL